MNADDMMNLALRIDLLESRIDLLEALVENPLIEVDTTGQKARRDTLVSTQFHGVPRIPARY